MAKLTLSVDDAVINRAKRYAAKHKISVSQIVETYLSTVADDSQRAESAPVLESLRGILKSANPEHYKRYLEKKYL